VGAARACAMIGLGMTPDPFEPGLVAILPVVWIASLLVASIVSRRRRGQPIVFFGVPNAAFIETRASGHSRRTWYTKLVGARKCLVVAVTGNRLTIRPRFPFTLIFLPEMFGLELDVPLHQVLHVVYDPQRSRAVHVQLREVNHEVHEMTLYLRKPQDFVDAMRHAVPVRGDFHPASREIRQERRPT
jgi:hypothetical protein